MARGAGGAVLVSAGEPEWVWQSSQGHPDWPREARQSAVLNSGEALVVWAGLLIWEGLPCMVPSVLTPVHR